MSSALNRTIQAVQLRNSAVAVTATGADTELTGAQLANIKHGIFVVDCLTLDVSSLDEAYTFILEGRQAAADAYTTLATITLAAGAGVVGLQAPVAVDHSFKRLRSRVVIAGTTPSTIYSAAFYGVNPQYGPANAVIKA